MAGLTDVMDVMDVMDAGARLAASGAVLITLVFLAASVAVTLALTAGRDQD